MSWAVLQASWTGGAAEGGFLCLGWLCVPYQCQAPLGLKWPFTPISKMASVKCEFMTNFTSEEVFHYNKFSIIGTESVSMAWATTILLKCLSNEHVFVVIDVASGRGGTVDFKCDRPFMIMPNTIASKNYLVTENTSLVIIVAGECQEKVEIHTPCLN